MCFLRTPLNNGQVNFTGITFCKLGCEGEVCLVILGNHNAPAGVFV